MSNDLSHDEKIEKLDKLIRDIGICMFTTVDADTGKLHSRPMAVQGGLDGHDLYFFSYRDSAKMDDVQDTVKVNCAFSCPKDQHYVSVEGDARMTFDRAKMEEKWDASLNAWFGKGLDTPGICMIAVRVGDAQYWDAPNNTLIHLYGMAKAAITGESVKDAGENEKVSM